MAFFHENAPHDPWASECARRLRETLGKKKRMQAKFNGKSWMNEFACLKREHGEQKVDSVLSWYLEHVGEEFTPAAFSARVFRQKFLQIQAAMSRQDDGGKEIIEERYKVKADALLNDYNFPPEIACRMPFLVQHTAKNWWTFTQKMRVSPLLPSKRESEFVERILWFHAPVFVDNWFIFLHRKFGRLSTYTGLTDSLIFKPNSQWFRDSFWRAWAMEWCGDCRVFDKLLHFLSNMKEPHAKQ